MVGMGKKTGQNYLPQMRCDRLGRKRVSKDDCFLVDQRFLEPQGLRDVLTQQNEQETR